MRTFCNFMRMRSLQLAEHFRPCISHVSTPEYNLVTRSVTFSLLGSSCAPLPSIPNGRVVGSSTIAGASVLFFCDSGYMLSSSSATFRTCQSSGSWTGSQPTCIGKLMKLFSCILNEISQLVVY